jgi:hypothetical protein
MNTVSLSYEELAQRMGITTKSARNHVRRKRWQTSLGNDGKARVTIPLDELPEATSEAPSAASSEPPSEAPSHPVHQLQARVAVLESQLASERALTDAERRRGDEAVERLAKIEDEKRALQADRDEWLRKAHRPWWRRLARS